MTGLLVSVRNREEAQLALAGGADLIDVKEPARGALGAADPAVWQAVRTVLGRRVPGSVALGELRDAHAPAAWPALAGFSYAKLGLAGCRARGDWPQRWAQRLRQLPPGLTRVAVVYADWRAAEAPPPEAILKHAAACRCGAVLIDTYDKRHGDLNAYFDRAALSALVAGIRRNRMRVVLGGSLDQASIPRVLELGPDYIAVRGAACAGTRRDALDESRVRHLAAVVKSP
jgi:(5-formylfuran-3-yl)methyl phosphate synthase